MEKQTEFNNKIDLLEKELLEIFRKDYTQKADYFKIRESIIFGYEKARQESQKGMIKIEDVEKKIEDIIQDYKGSLTKNTHKKTKVFLKQFIKDLEYIKQSLKELGEK